MEQVNIPFRLKRLCVPRKAHWCRVCCQIIQKGAPCERWTGVQSPEGWWTCHAHPECLDQTYIDKWDEGDWECQGWEMEMTRPTEKRKCFMCGGEGVAWFALLKRPRHVCSEECYRNYCNATDIT